MPATITSSELTRAAFRRSSEYPTPLPPEGGDLAQLARSWRRSLEDRDLSPNTIYIYLTSLKLFGQFLDDVGMPMLVGSITAEHIREFLRHLEREGRAANTRTNRHQALATFFAWVKAEGERTDNPMLDVNRPKPKEVPPELMPDEDVKKLLFVCRRDEDVFLGRRDEAIIRMFFDTGARRSSVAYVRTRDLSLDEDPASVTFVGKGQHVYVAGIGRKAAAALDRYLRVRARHKHARNERLWVGRQGPLDDKAIDLILRKRAREAGVRVHAHMFRHAFAHAHLSHPDAKEGDIARQGGWRGTAMLRRYGAAAAEQRAREAHVRLGLGDRL